MRYILLIMLFWHQASMPLDINFYIKNTVEHCFNFIKTMLNNDMRANYVIACAALTAGVTSFSVFFKKTLAKINHKIKRTVKFPQQPVIEITKVNATRSKISAASTLHKRKPSYSVLLPTPPTSPFQSRPTSRRNSRNCEHIKQQLSTVIEEEFQVDLLRSFYGDCDKDQPLSQEEIDAILKIPDIGVSPDEQKPKQTIREQMLEKYQQLPPDASPVVMTTKKGVYWLGWRSTPIPDMHKLTLTFNGQEVPIVEQRTIKKT